MKHSLLSLLLLFSATSVTAQELTFRGKVEDVSGMQNQFFLDCTDVDLSSALFDLNNWIGVQTEITGMWNGSLAQPAVIVTEIAAVLESFEIGGGGRIGEQMSFEVTGPPGALAAAYFSPSAGFLPLRQGVVLIDLSADIKVGQGTIPALGTREFQAIVPNDPGLVGLVVHGQGFYIDGQGVTVTNPDCKELRN